MDHHDTPATPERTAALIAAIMLRFGQQDLPQLGNDPSAEPSYLILPDGPRLKDRELIDWLEKVAKPLFAVPTYIRGMIAAWPAVASSQIRHALANQQQAIAEFQEAHQLAESAKILLETGSEAVEFPLSHLKGWAANYVACVGWNGAPPQAGAPARLVLTAPGRRFSPGSSGRKPDHAH